MTATRRNFLSVATALAIVPAVPAVAATIGADAELLRLAALLEPLEQERNVRLASDRNIHVALDAAMYRRTGLTAEEAREEAHDHHYWRIWQSVYDEIAGLDYGQYEDENGDTWWNRFWHRMAPVLAAIAAERATTLAGLKVQAHAVALAPGVCDEDSEDSDERDFVILVCGFFGMDAAAIAEGRPS